MSTWRLWLARALLVAAIVGWPLSALTVARQEPQFILGLSWLAIILAARPDLDAAHTRKAVNDRDA